MSQYQEEIIKDFKLNKPQARALTVLAKFMYLLFARATGKTQGVLAPMILFYVQALPRSSGGFIALSFEDAKGKTLPALTAAFSMMGLTRGVDYEFGKKPPKGWAEPYLPVIDYAMIFSFPNGTTMQVLSMAKMSAANGLSLQWLIADEAKFLDESKLKKDILPILRGNKHYFGDSPWYGAMLFVTDKMSANIHWLLKKRKEMNEQVVNTVIYLQLMVNDLRHKMTECSERTAYTIMEQVKKIEHALAELRKDMVYVGEASALDNIENLGASYFIDQKIVSSEIEYEVQILNYDPTRAEKTFYPDRNETHLYNEPYDEDTTKPLGVVFDYQASITPLVSFQVNDLVVPGVKTLNILRSDYVLYPEGLEAVINKFCERHKTRKCKEVYYYYDHTAIAKKAGHKSFYQEVEEYYNNNGWIVHMYYMGRAPYHNTKYNRIKYYLANASGQTMHIRMHQVHCALLVISMDMSETKENGVEGKGTEKNKDSERLPNVDQTTTTHFSDCFDQIVWAVLERDMYPSDEAVGIVGGVRTR